MTKNLIIGAGPAGLAVAGRMRKAGLEFEILEKSNNVGSAWHGHYDRLHLHTVKQWSHLPGLEFPKDYPLYVPRAKFVEYFEKYASHFDIRPQFGEEILSIKKSDKNWSVNSKTGKIFIAENVIIATGLNRVPNIPTWKGQENFEGKITHARFYKNPLPFAEKNVMVVGMGNTGAEIALDLAEAGIKTWLSVRGKVSIVPRDLNGRPVQVTGKQLEKLPFGLGDWLGTQIRKVYFGNLSKYGLKIDTTPPAKLLRKYGKTPVIDLGTIKAVKEEKIKVTGDIDRFSEKKIHLKSGKSVEIDAVILATGYHSKIENLLERGEETFDDFGKPNPPVADGFHQGIYFVGFDNYKLGGILGTIFVDSEIVVEELVRRQKVEKQ